ncbi:BNR repeat-containing protein [Actinomycetes bacterium KLBMP 9797]
MPGAPGLRLLGDAELDPTALFFVSYQGIVNTASYQQSGLLTHAGHQYAAWYTGSRHAVVARRRLPHGAWESVRLPHRLSVDDSHNTISLGVSPVDGRLHVAMDTHDNQIYYSTVEGPVLRTLDGLDLGAITYPRFLVTPEGRLQLSYRTGRSGRGAQELAEYDGTWKALGAWSSPDGEYTANGATSTSRNMYLHGLHYGPTGRLHAAFTWREDDTAVLAHPGGLANHDTGYVYSDDRGRRWHNLAGEVVARTGTDHLVTVASPGLVVDPLGVDHGLINQESLAIDRNCQPHVVISYVPPRLLPKVSDVVRDREAHGRAFHLYRDVGGRWHKTEIPLPVAAFGRSQLVLGRDDNAYLVMPYGRILTASAASGWTDWAPRFEGAGLGAFGEVVVDRARMAADGVLSVLYQRPSTGDTPSPIHVADFHPTPSP